MLRKWMLAIIAATTLTFGPNLTSVSAQTKPGAMASPAGKMAKKMPARDAKGRFVKASPSPAPMTTMPTKAMPAKKMPMRDAKGRFMKASPSPAPASKMMKTMPPRDAKGRFMKKTAATPPPAPKK